MSAFLTRGLLKTPAIRFAAVDCAELCSEAVVRHDADPGGAAVLGEALTVTALLSVLLGEGETYGVRLAYRGRAGKIVADVNDRAEVRGFTTAPHLGLPPLAPDDLYGESAQVSLLRSADHRILNSGETECRLASPAADLAFFFSVSDQVETAANAALAFRADPKRPVERARGLLLQAMPQCDLAAFDAIRRAVERPAFRGELLAAGNGAPEAVTAAILRAAGCDTAPENLVFGQTLEPRFRCRCGRESLLRALLTIDRNELDRMFREKPELELRCEFCRRTYRFRAADLPDRA